MNSIYLPVIKLIRCLQILILIEVAIISFIQNSDKKKTQQIQIQVNLVQPKETLVRRAMRY